ncbi:DUF4912 domain-containing protein [Myxococcus sp. AM009]|uniref:DUF4912 domain-containing protein n=1 Tax=Myxococcus sp. AM009 TaxID=2745137 RepID=UPI001595C86D|nr:DUF4912 domain-containing protein [Myxococcus sp. AM009]NVJ02776.1 DUF4912 domain-containing protein [Myxococcus sp. AM009]
MEDLKSVTVSYLRELARKHLGSGYSRMKKEELLAALAAYVPALGRLARLAGIRVPAKSSTPKPEAAGSQGQGRVSAPKRVAAKRTSERPGSKPPARPAQVVTFPPKPRVERARESVTPVTSSLTKSPEPAPPPVARPAPAQKAAEPVVEGFFVARVAGEEEARSHHLVEAAPAPPPPPVDTEGLGELPEGYQDDAVLLLPRDPHTLFVSWDFSLGALLRAQDALEAPSTVLRVFGDEQMEQALDFAVEARGFYIQGLPAGRTYRVEAHCVGRDGRSRRIGASSNRVTLPPAGVSTDLTVRFLRVPPLEAALPEAVVEAPPPEEEREYVSWRRVNLPGSGGVLDVPEVHRERRGRDVAEAHLEGPARAPGASDQRYVGSVGRAAGASDQRYQVDEARGPVTAPVPRYLEPLGRAPGASDMRYAEGGAREAGRGQPSRTYLDVKGIPGASDLRYADGGAAGSTGSGASPHRYLDVKGIPGASDLRHADGGATRSPVSGASPHRYLDVRSTPGASDLRYLESPPRAPGASEQRHLGSPPQRTSASDRRIADAPAPPSGASDRQHEDASSARTKTETSAKAARGSGAQHPPAVEEHHRYFEAPPRPSRAAVPDRDAQEEGDAADTEEHHRYFEVPRPRGEDAAPQRTAAPASFETREGPATPDAAEPPPRKPPSEDGRS